VPSPNAENEFACLLEAHRQGRPAREVQFFDHLCFALEGTRDVNGVKYVLWRPFAQFIEQHFDFEIEETICEGEVVLAYLDHAVENFVRKTVRFIENGRRKSPYFTPESSYQVIIGTIPEVVAWLRSNGELDLARLAETMHRDFKRAVRSGQFGSALRRSRLSALASQAPDWAVDTCIDFLRCIETDSYESQPISIALASERSLARDWLTPEEEAAWSYLLEAKS
jgi:hypothetical protein